MYVFYYNLIISTAMKNRGEKDMITAFTSLTEDFKNR